MAQTTADIDVLAVLSAIDLGSKEDKRSMAHAIFLGYRFVLGQDGEAQIRSPKGDVYFVAGFVCDCPDKVYRDGSYEGLCKHEIWTYQVMPCPICGKTMAMGTFTTCFGEAIQRFECTDCGHARDASLVFQGRYRSIEHGVM